MDRLRPRAFAVTLAALTLTGCQGGGPRARAEAKALSRQAETLRDLIAAVETDQAFSSKHVTLGIGHELVRDLLQLTLPVETVATPDLRVRLETAEVAFDSGESRVTLRGRVSRASSPRTFADLVVYGGLHRFEVGERGGQVTARVALDRVEVRQAEAEGLRRDLLEAVVDRLGAPTLETLALQIPPIAIPVRFERALELEAMSAGPFDDRARQPALPRGAGAGRGARGPALGARRRERHGRRATDGPGGGGPVRRWRRAAFLAVLLFAGASPTRASGGGPAPKRWQRQRREVLRLGERLERRLREQARLRDSSGASVLVGVPAGVAERLAGEAVAGFGEGIRITLRDLRFRKSDEVRARVLLGRRSVGRYVLSVHVHEVGALLRPGKPRLRLDSERAFVTLPVAVEDGAGRARLRFKWDGRGMAVACAGTST